MNGPVWLASGQINGGLSLDGFDDYLTASNSTLLNSMKGQMSAALWVRKKADHPNYACMAGRRKGSGYNDLWLLNYNNSGQDEYSFNMSTTGGFTSVTGPSSAGDVNAWVHVAGVYDGSRIHLYRNGAEAASAACSGTIPDESTSVFIGAGDNGSYGITEYLNADLDDIRLYNRALSASEVSDLYNQGSTSMQTAKTGAGLNEPFGLTASPNPFNPSVTLGVHGIKGQAQLAIYDLTGRKVADLTGKAKNHSIVWDASSMPNGAYVVKLVNGKQSMIKRIMLIK
jgi:hypothetical protein